MALDSSSMRQERATAPQGGLLLARVLYGKVTLTQKALFAKHMAVMLRSGLTITEALHTAIDTSSGRLKQIMKEVEQSVQAGKPLSTALAGYQDVFSDLFVNVVYVGEASGTLVENLENLAVQIEKERDLRAKLLGAMIYPIIVFSATFILSLVLAFVVLPKLIPLFQGLKVQLPLSTRILIAMAGFIENHVFLIVGSVFGTLAGLTFLVRQRFVRPITHYVLLKIPLIGPVVHDVNLVLFARTLRMLLTSGLNIDETIEIAHNAVSNHYYQQALRDVSRAIRTGTKLSQNLARYNDLFPPLVSRMVRVGEESGQLEETLSYLESFYEKEVDNSTKTLSIAIEPVLLLVLGLGVGFLALSIITPIYSITGSIGK